MFGLRSYFELLARYPWLPAFGFLTALGSSFGQTFFIGVFSPAIQSEFVLSHTAWGAVYLAGTLASALVLPWTGRLVDRVRLPLFAVSVWFLLSLACLVFSLAGSPAGLVLGIFLLRQGGQGLMSHVALTTMARYFDAARGKAIAVATLGFSCGQAVLPLAAVLALAWIGWRGAYRGASVALVAGALAAGYLVTKGVARHTAAGELRNAARERNTAPPAVLRAASWTRRQVLGDRRFYLILPGVLCPSIVITAMFFHHLNLADMKGWSHAWIAGNYVLYAAASTAASMIAGPLIDRYGAVRLVQIMLLPQAAGLLALAFSDDAWVIAPYLVAMGVTTALSHTGVAALWAEVYGVVHLGAIRALAASVSVFGSSLGPVLMGALLDLGFGTPAILSGFALYSAAATVLIALAFRLRCEGFAALEEK